MANKATALLVLAIMVVGSFFAYQFYLAPSAAGCRSPAGGTVTKGITVRTTFGAVTEYKLPGLDRWPNAVAAAPDGSVWFAEQEVPGVAHLYPGNGTVVEYAWPGYPMPKPPDCIPSVSASGIALWNGRVWAANEFGNAIVGVSPGDGSALTVNTTGKADFPYWLAVGPDGALWFTSDNAPARLGRIAPDMTLTVISLAGLGAEDPIQLDFGNSSIAYISTINQSTNSTTHSCICNGHIYSFNPSAASTTITPVLVGGEYKLILPTSVSYSGGSLWVAQHGASSVAGYDLARRSWTKYPTSTVPWVDTTLPLVVDGSQGRVWFNEHYANKISLLNPGAGTLTEYSESNPPASNYTQIQNDLSIAATKGGLWFTSMSGNYIGFVDGSHDPGFSVAISGANTATFSAGGNVSFGVRVAGSWSVSMKVSVSDSEDSTSTPKLIQIVPNVPAIPNGISSYILGVKIMVDQKVPAGSYTAAVTVSNGDVQQTVYYFIVVK